MLFEPILALDTSAGASVCLIKPDGSVGTAVMQTPRAHSRELLPLLQKVLQDHEVSWQDIQAFAVGVGPGSFTGLRVACATISGINASLKKPVFSLSSLSITAKQVESQDSYWVLEDARSGLVYAAQFKGEQCITEAQCMTWDECLALKPSLYVSLSDMPFALDDWQALPIVKTREQALVEVVQSLDKTQQSNTTPEPLYLQVSQAEKNLK